MIPVKIDQFLKLESELALGFWARRLGVAFNVVDQSADCMVYVHLAARDTIPLAMRSQTDHLTSGAAFLQGTKRFDGVAYIVTVHSSVIAHEVGHLLGFDHAPGGVMEAHAPEDWRVSDDQINLAHANRIRARLNTPPP